MEWFGNAEPGWITVYAALDSFVSYTCLPIGLYKCIHLPSHPLSTAFNILNYPFVPQIGKDWENSEQYWASWTMNFLNPIRYFCFNSCSTQTSRVPYFPLLPADNEKKIVKSLMDTHWRRSGGDEYEECWEQLNLQNANQPVRSNFPFLSYSSCFLYSSVIVVIIIICYCYSNQRITLLMGIRPTVYTMSVHPSSMKSRTQCHRPQAKPSQAKHQQQWIWLWKRRAYIHTTRARLRDDAEGEGGGWGGWGVTH